MSSVFKALPSCNNSLSTKRFISCDPITCVFSIDFQKGSKIEHVAPLLTDQDFNRMVGHFSQSIFCSNSTRAFTATSVGNVVVWDNNRPISGREYILLSHINQDIIIKSNNIKSYKAHISTNKVLEALEQKDKF